MDARGNSHFAQPEDNIEEEELKKVLSETIGSAHGKRAQGDSSVLL